MDPSLQIQERREEKKYLEIHMRSEEKQEIDRTGRTRRKINEALKLTIEKRSSTERAT